MFRLFFQSVVSSVTPCESSRATRRLRNSRNSIRVERRRFWFVRFNNHTVVQMEATNPITIQNNKPCHRLYKFHVTSILTDDGHAIVSPSSRVDNASPTSPRHHVLAPDGNGHTTAVIGDVRKSDSSRNPKSEGKFRQ